MNSQEVIEIDLVDLWRIFVKKWYIMLLAACLVAGVYWGYAEKMVAPKYVSTSTLYILKQQDDSEKQNSSNTASDFTLALNVVKDCTYLLKSHSVLDTVIADEELNMSYTTLYNSISTNNPNNTRVLQVTVEVDSPEEAKKIVDAVCKVGVDRIETAMGFRQVNVYEEGTLRLNRSNGASFRNMAVFGLAVAFLIYAVYVIRFLFDDRIRTDEDIEEKLGLSILGSIPDANTMRRRKKRQK
ncbi:MAG: Wzz/FepE/Etk N-terminal domain-containing protein [Eubacteriales bacterium]|nr:Wzz/FepE/Etk N-terminal domain-containing protein [Eubacteriales bacterium]